MQTVARLAHRTFPTRAAIFSAARSSPGLLRLPPALRSFHPDAKPAQQVAVLPPPAIAFPPNGAVVPLPDDKAADTSLQFKADGGRAPLTWLVNGEPMGSFDRFAPALYTPQGEGLARVTVVDADGRSDTSQIRFKKIR